ncbi:MAG: hypothetical protein MZW92_37760 [Comamonadaceae bacterium]|nr:hypothetical protein [Comamonadaceae bacterium]
MDDAVRISAPAVEHGGASNLGMPERSVSVVPALSCVAESGELNDGNTPGTGVSDLNTGSLVKTLSPVQFKQQLFRRVEVNLLKPGGSRDSTPLRGLSIHAGEGS